MQSSTESTAPSRLTEKLKAERVQERLKAERVQEKLKAERVQERLESELPGWTVADRGGLRRVFAFPSARAAALFVPLAAEIGETAGHVPTVELRGPEVTVTVATAPGPGVAPVDFDLASLLDPGSVPGRNPRPGGSEAAEEPGPTAPVAGSQ